MWHRASLDVCLERCFGLLLQGHRHRLHSAVLKALGDVCCDFPVLWALSWAGEGSQASGSFSPHRLWRVTLWDGRLLPWLGHRGLSCCSATELPAKVSLWAWMVPPRQSHQDRIFLLLWGFVNPWEMPVSASESTLCCCACAASKGLQHG